ncbi:polymer-forming cytoskeletal protein [Clostridium lacusfryxellense]|uniref:polymer-forming cytoskeletal protein n=1 Tax=Clostridium lacusfryxellense TaxID=205328 RepID=UPI001C0DF86C|nr:polymer-forming cytoskeletal protein [Clostridium lacusfryxellense]MBU3110253.1 polymer-forming cytoskeletal protein [Clostridium lacusfryxellense]
MKKKKGSVLILTLVVVLLLMVIGTSLMTVSVSTHKTEIISDNINRINMMAESGIELGLAQANSTVGLVNFGGVKSDDGTITCNVIFQNGLYSASTNSYIQTLGRYTIESTASSTKNSRTIRVPITQVISTPETPVGIIPTANLLFINGEVQSGKFNLGEAKGDVFVKGNLNMSNGSAIKGKLMSTGNLILDGGNSVTKGIVCSGNITVTGGGSVSNKIVSFGNVIMNGGSATTDGIISYGNFNFIDGTVNGNALVKGNLTFGGGPNIKGNAQADGNLSMTSGGNIKNNAIIGGNVTFAGGGNKISGTLKYRGTETIPSKTTLNTFVSSTVEHTITYTPVDLSSYSSNNPVDISSSILPIIAVPTRTQNPQMYNPVTLNTVTPNSYTITESGKLSSALLDVIPWHSTLTIDATKKNINLLIDSNFKFDKQLNVEVLTGTGTEKQYNVYIYLSGNSSITVDNQYFGMKNHNDTTTKIYIIGDGNQSVNLNSCNLNANIYLPSGNFSTGGGAGGASLYMFQGSCITKTVDIQGNIKLSYLAPVIKDTPLEILNSNQSGSGTTTSAWVVDK